MKRRRSATSLSTCAMELSCRRKRTRSGSRADLLKLRHRVSNPTRRPQKNFSGRTLLLPGVKIAKLTPLFSGRYNLSWPLSGSNSVVECDLAKVEVAGSTPVSRSISFRFCRPRQREGLCSQGQARRQLSIQPRYPSGKGEVCKTFIRRFDSDPRLHSFGQPNI